MGRSLTKLLRSLAKIIIKSRVTSSIQGRCSKLQLTVGILYQNIKGHGTNFGHHQITTSFVDNIVG